MITVNVSRFNKETDSEPYFESYEIEKTQGMKLLDALQAINEKYDADISFRSSCRAGQCGSCSVKYNGDGVLACQQEVEDNCKIEAANFPIIKDLIVDRSSVDEKVQNLHLSCQQESSEEVLNETMPNSQLKDTKKVRSCIECYSCLSSCPVVKYFEDEFGGPFYLRYLSKFDFDPRDIKDRLSESLEEGLYKCTSCGKCREVCPKNINTFGDAIEKLRAIACQEGKGPLPKHVAFKENIIETGRSVKGEGKSFIEEAGVEGKSKIALFTGCMVDKKLKHVGHALVNVLKKHGIEIDIPKEQVCCGSPLLRTGQTDIIQSLVDKNKEVFKDYDIVLTICAGCGSTLKNNHPEYGSQLNVMDISEFLDDKLNLEDMKELDMTVTWHDPCHLYRGQGIETEPRDILKKIKGINFVEMEKPNQCCGAGGGIKAGHPEIALKLSTEKAKMIKDTGAEAVITICPFCQHNIQDGLNHEGLFDVKAMNILELLEKSYSD